MCQFRSLSLAKTLEDSGIQKGCIGADARAFKDSAQAILLRHLGEHLPRPLVRRQAYKNEYVGNQR